MSRFYRLNLEAKDEFVKEAVRKIVAEKFGWVEIDLGSFEGIIYFDGKGLQELGKIREEE